MLPRQAVAGSNPVSRSNPLYLLAHGDHQVEAAGDRNRVILWWSLDTGWLEFGQPVPASSGIGQRTDRFPQGLGTLQELSATLQACTPDTRYTVFYGGKSPCVVNFRLVPGQRI